MIPNRTAFLLLVPDTRVLIIAHVYTMTGLISAPLPEVKRQAALFNTDLFKNTKSRSPNSRTEDSQDKAT